jgi:hypothetical protein
MSRAKSGGGIRSRVVKRVGQNLGPRSSNKVSPSAVDMLGQSTSFKRPPLIKGTMPQVPLGNDLSTNVGKGAPGAGRVTMHCGSQGTHGPVTAGTPKGGNAGKDILSEFGPEKSRG